MNENERELERKIIWLERRYNQLSKAIADTTAETLPLELQQKFFLSLAKKLEQIKRADLTRNI